MIKLTTKGYNMTLTEQHPPPQQRRIIEEVVFTYYPLGKTFEKQTKAILGYGKKTS